MSPYLRFRRAIRHFDTVLGEMVAAVSGEVAHQRGSSVERGPSEPDSAQDPGAVREPLLAIVVPF